MNSRIFVLAALIGVVVFSTAAEAKHHHHRHHRLHRDAIVHVASLTTEALPSIKTYTPEHQAEAQRRVGCRNNTVKEMTAFGISICVDPRFASKFLIFFEKLKATGARVTSIVCQAYGHAPGSNHIGGGACDVNQMAKNRTIPAMYHAGNLIREAGLYDGCSFHDCGHVEAMRGLGNYGYAGTGGGHRRHGRAYASAETPSTVWTGQ